MNNLTTASHTSLVLLFYNLGPTKPLAVNAVNVSSTELNVTWTVPKRRNGILTGYTIYYRLVKNGKNENVADNSSTVSKNTTQTSFNLSGLGKNFFFKFYFFSFKQIDIYLITKEVFWIFLLTISILLLRQYT